MKISATLGCLLAVLLMLAGSGCHHLGKQCGSGCFDGGCAGGDCTASALIGGCPDGSCEGAHAGDVTGCAGNACDGRCGGRCLAALAAHTRNHCLGTDCGRVVGPTAGAVTYPYYTLRGPRDFLVDDPPSIGR